MVFAEDSWMHLLDHSLGIRLVSLLIFNLRKHFRGRILMEKDNDAGIDGYLERRKMKYYVDPKFKIDKW